MLSQEAMELGREIAVGLSKAGLLLGASPVPVRLVQPGYLCSFFVSGAKATLLHRVSVVPEPLVSLGRRNKDRLQPHGFPKL